MLVASSCALRIGEWSELRKKDIEVDRAGQVVLSVSRQVADGGVISNRTKSGKSRRVYVPPAVVVHLATHVEGLGDDDLLFPNARGDLNKRPRLNLRGGFHRHVLCRGVVNNGVSHCDTSIPSTNVCTTLCAAYPRTGYEPAKTRDTKHQPSQSRPKHQTSDPQPAYPTVGHHAS